MNPAGTHSPRARAHPWKGTPLVLIALFVLLAALPGAFAQSQEDLDAQVRRISGQLRCPTCQGLSVQDSDASFSVQIRNKVRAMSKEGQSEEAIIAYFVSRYGQWILRAPEKSGFGLVLWVLPFGLTLAAGLWIGGKIWLNARVRTPALDPPQMSEAQLLRIDADLKRFEEED